MVGEARVGVVKECERRGLGRQDLAGQAGASDQLCETQHCWIRFVPNGERYMVSAEVISREELFYLFPNTQNKVT